jgi:hypothetical protein
VKLVSFGCMLVMWTAAFPSVPSLVPQAHPENANVAPGAVHVRQSSSPKARVAALFRPIGRLGKSSQAPGTNFAAASDYGSGGYLANSVAVADINGDSKPDLLVVNECANSDGSGCVGNGTVSVLVNNGDGTFQPAIPYASGGYQALSVAVADLSGDGKPDLLVANSCVDNSNCDNGAVGVLLGNGDGTFQPPVTYNSGGYQATSVAFADVNRDGVLDLQVVNQCASSDTCADGGQIAVLLGNGDGTFQPAATYSSGGYQAVSVAVSDVNADGNPDLLLANHCADSNCASNGTVSVLLGNGDGTFQAAVTSGSGGFQASSVVVADLNGDGVPDLLVANNCVDSNCANGTVGVLLGNGDGSFQAAASYSSRGYDSGSVATGDVNGDGKPDLLVANQCATSATCANGGLVGVLLGNGDGTFQNAVTYGSGGNQASSLAVSDVNGDGKPDVLVANQCFDSSCTNGGIGVLLNISTKASTTALLASPAPSGFGQVVTLTATVTPSATGTITFTDGATTLGTAILIGGTASLSTSSLNSGTHSLSAGYSGDSNFAPSASSTVSQIVNQASTTVSLSPSQNPGYLTQPVTFTATMAGQFGGATSGSVTFYSGSTALGNATAFSGQAVFSTTFAATGSFSISAIYSGDSNNATSTSSVLSESVTRIPTSATISSGLNPSNYGQAVTFTATITFAPGTPPSNETVNFKEITSGGEIQLGTSPLTGNTAVFSISTLSMGTHNIKVQYVGDKLFMNSHSVTVAQVINKAATSTSLRTSLTPSLYGQSVTFTATVTGGTNAPTGKVTFKRGLNALGTATLSGGSAALTTSTLNAGSATVTATYAGDSYNSTSTSPALSQQVNKAPTITALTSSPNPSSAGQPVTFTATLSSTTGPVPTGTVTFKDGNTTLCSGSLSGGVVGCTASNLSKGSHTIKANYITTANFLGSSASVTQTVK